MPVPCTHDLTITAGKYFFALETGDVPLMFQFSGTIFWRDEDGSLQVAPISWSKEAAFRLPVTTWRALMEEHDPDSAWLCLRRDTVDKLNRYKAHSGVPGWDAALTRLLEAAEGPRGYRERTRMTTSTLDRLVAATLYEGYILYPYRPSSVKNQVRWTFGGVHPRAWSEASGGTDPWFVQTECLLRGGDARGGHGPRPVSAAGDQNCREAGPAERLARRRGDGEARGRRGIAGRRRHAPRLGRGDGARHRLWSSPLAALLAARGGRRTLLPRSLRRGVTARTTTGSSSARWSANASRCGVDVSVVAAERRRRPHPGACGRAQHRRLQPHRRSRPRTRAATLARSRPTRSSSPSAGSGCPSQTRPRSCRRGRRPAATPGSGRSSSASRGQSDTVLASPIILEDHPQVAPEVVRRSL